MKIKNSDFQPCLHPKDLSSWNRKIVFNFVSRFCLTSSMRSKFKIILIAQNQRAFMSEDRLTLASSICAETSYQVLPHARGFVVRAFSARRPFVVVSCLAEFKPSDRFDSPV